MPSHSLEFAAEMRILAEMKIDNRQAYFFFYEIYDGGAVNAYWRYKTDIDYEF